jgi:hypothetical protein
MDAFLTGALANGHNGGCPAMRSPTSRVFAKLLSRGHRGRNRSGLSESLDQVARLIEIFGIDGAADIVGCPLRRFGDGGERVDSHSFAQNTVVEPHFFIVKERVKEQKAVLTLYITRTDARL